MHRLSKSMIAGFGAAATLTVSDGSARAQDATEVFIRPSQVVSPSTPITPSPGPVPAPIPTASPIPTPAFVFNSVNADTCILTEGEDEDCALTAREAYELLIEREAEKTAEFFGMAITPDQERNIGLAANGIQFLSILGALASFAVGWQYRKSTKVERDKARKDREHYEVFANKNRAEMNRLMARMNRSIDIDRALQNVRITRGDIASGLNIKRTIGEFPATLPYLTQRIETARDQVLLMMPYYTYGLYLEPSGWRDFNETLFEKITRAQDADITLVVPPEDTRMELIAERFAKPPQDWEQQRQSPRMRELVKVLELSAVPESWFGLVAALQAYEKQAVGRLESVGVNIHEYTEEQQAIDLRFIAILGGEESIKASQYQRSADDPERDLTRIRVGWTLLLQTRGQFRGQLPESTLSKLDGLLEEKRPKSKRRFGLTFFKK